MESKATEIMRVNIAVTSISTGVAQSILDSLEFIRNYNVLGIDSSETSYARKKCDRFKLIPFLPYDSNYLNTILQICISNRISIVIPSNDNELELFSRNREKFENHGIKVLVCNKPDLIAISRNKKRWSDFFQAKGCPVVETFYKEDLIHGGSIKFPLIAKPISGSSSNNIHIIHKLEELIFLDNNKDYVIQPFLFPLPTDENFESIKNNIAKGILVQKSEISVQLLFTQNSELSGIFISKNTLKGGVPIIIKPINPKKYEYISEINKFIKVLQEIRVNGPVNLQGRESELGLVFFEMNLRFTGITGTRTLFGWNEVYNLCQNLLNNEIVIELGDYNQNKIGTRQVACEVINPKKTKVNNLAIMGGGSNLGVEFLDRFNGKFEKIFLIHRNSSLLKYLSFINKYNNVELVSFENYNELSNMFFNSDAFINMSSALRTEDDQHKFNSIENIYELCEILKNHTIPLIINISSQSVYDTTSTSACRENSKLTSKDVYAFQKTIHEKFFSSIQQYSKESRVISIRFPRILNASDLNSCGYYGKVLLNILEGKIVNLPILEETTSIIDVEDAINAIQYIIENIPSINNDFEALNFSSFNLSIQELTESLIIKTNSKSEIIRESNRIQNIKSSILDTSLAIELGLKPGIDKEDFVNRLLLEGRKKLNLN